ncbi:MAG: DUF2065 domain-containing protein [Acidihalobacter sp.]|jgi:uncharacterized protein
MWQDFLAALALMMVLEGIPFFLSPASLRRSLQMVMQLSDNALRAIGLVSMAAGALLLYLVRH